ncbi:uncharacterized protein LOC124664687 [Lolium rigidum]|uniref:uncharacterized protein LOC124664687 n=1 Tax=Lolium rigidum TaxID=89674 RepID=UPI001F5D84FD|nr:uncharacterized protein LOC124664687 [Lolium rigidum]
MRSLRKILTPGRALSNRPGVASTRPPPATWSITACPTYLPAAENVLPGRSNGGKRHSFHGKKPPAEPDRKQPAEPDKKRRGLKLLRFLRSRLARVSRLPSVLRHMKPPLPPPPPSPPRAAVANSGPRTPAIPFLMKNLALMRPATTTVFCFVAGFAVSVASISALRLMAGFMIPSGSCTLWRCFLAKKFLQFLGPPLFEWLSKISLKLVNFLDAPVLCEWLARPKLTLKCLFNK